MIRKDFEEILAASKLPDRFALWTAFLNKIQPVTMLEIGVWKGDYARAVLSDVSSVKRYYMLDPWRHLEDWNKGFNVDDKRFDHIYRQAMKATGFASEKRTVLRGTTVEVIEQIPDESLDFVYIDGDHTLRGITIDLGRVYPKVRPGGVIGGDDFSRSVWQHAKTFEPTFVFPYATYFAEMYGHEIIALPFLQFAIPKVPGGYAMAELAEGYADRTVMRQFRQPRHRRSWLSRNVRRLIGIK